MSLGTGLTPGEITLHSNKDRHICIKTHVNASPEIITWLTSKSTPEGFNYYNPSLWHDNEIQSFENSGTKLNGARNITGGLPWCYHSSSSTHSSSQPGEISPDHTSAKALPRTTDYSKAEYVLTYKIIAKLSMSLLNKTYPSATTTSPTLDMRSFWPLGFILLKSNKEYVLTFKILAQVLVDYSFLS
jgi:hypothetical protein